MGRNVIRMTRSYDLQWRKVYRHVCLETSIRKDPCCCATVRTLLRSPRGDAAAPPAFSLWPRWLASFHSCLPVPPASAPSAADRSPHRMVPECVALLPPTTSANSDHLPC